MVRNEGLMSFKINEFFYVNDENIEEKRASELSSSKIKHDYIDT